MGAAQKSQADAWRIFDAVADSQRVDWLTESPGVERAWRQIASRPSPSHKLWTDDYLAAMALVERARLVTFDAGFKAYSGLKLELLTMPAPVSAPTS